ncbi:hypothetical protein [Amnibacterium endophyticum]|uniref:Uncharacterized protein n=1 Tax=Amnibacterium endophyticum TaxID=2109337 RepID=A0ABW4LB74_9MICO
MRRALIYFGTDQPDAAWSTAQRHADVVLQPYHALAAEGGYAERFPHARRYVYVNPTSVDPWLLEHGAPGAPVAGWDQRWNLPRIDPATPAGMDWAVRTALEALALDGGRSRGLFVDDLDRLLPEDPATALRFLRLVEDGAERPVRWFVNRAFALWDRIAGLDAVLLEDMAPSVTRHAPVGEVRWIRETVLPAVDAARAREVAVHAVAYADQEGLSSAAPDLVLQQDLGRRLDSVVTGLARTASSWEVYA